MKVLILLGYGLLIILGVMVYLKKRPKVPSSYKFTLVDCSNCNGKGTVYYGPDDPVVKLNPKFEGGPFTCPICGGEGTLELQEKIK